MNTLPGLAGLEVTAFAVGLSIDVVSASDATLVVSGELIARVSDDTGAEVRPLDRGYMHCCS